MVEKCEREREKKKEREKSSTIEFIMIRKYLIVNENRHTKASQGQK